MAVVGYSLRYWNRTEHQLSKYYFNSSEKKKGFHLERSSHNAVGAFINDVDCCHFGKQDFLLLLILVLLLILLLLLLLTISFMLV